MKNKTEKMKDMTTTIFEKLGSIMKRSLRMLQAIIVALLIYAVYYGISWIATCIVLKLIAMCFDISFNWLIATGIWLILQLLKQVFKQKA